MYFYKYFGATHLEKRQSCEIFAAAELRNICRNGSKNDQKVQRSAIYLTNNITITP
jgi:hypothetical protein